MKSSKVLIRGAFYLFVAGVFLMGSSNGVPAQPTPTPVEGEAVGYIMVDGLGGIHTTSRSGPLVSPFVAAGIHDLTAEDPILGSLPDIFFGWDIARGLALTPDQDGFWILDGFGGLFPYGAAQKDLPVDATGTLLYFGWDIARDIEAGPDASGVEILDGYGAVHALGSAQAAGYLAEDRPYFGWDIARDVEMTEDLGGFVLLDGYGGLHYVGNAAEQFDPGEEGPYFGFDIAKDVEPSLDGTKGLYVLDRLGGVFALGTARDLPTAYFGWDVAEDLEQLYFPDLVADPAHLGIALWQLDAYGGIHPAESSTSKLAQMESNMVQFSLIHYIGYDIARDFEVVSRPGQAVYPTMTPSETPFTPTPTLTPEFTPTLTPTETSFVPTPTPTATLAPSTFDMCNYFPLDADSSWYYVGFEGGSTEDNFTWEVQDTLKDLGGGQFATRVKTITDEATDDRNQDEDFWTCEGNGDLLIHGIHKGTAVDVATGVTLLVQDVIFSDPLKFGGAGQQIGDEVTDSATATVSLSVGSLTATIDSTVSYTDMLASKTTPLGTFTNVLRIVVSLDVTADLGFPLGQQTFALRDNTFFLKEGVGMIAQDQEPDQSDAEIQAIDSGQVGGVAIVAD